MKNGFLKIESILFRICFLVCPFLATRVARFSRAVFSPNLNERTILKAGLGLKCLDGKMVDSPALSISLHLPFSVKLSLDDYTQASAFYTGLPPICSTLMEHADEDSLFFDIGANIGLVSLAMGKVLSSSSIHSIEINPLLFKKLQRTVKLNCPGVHTHQIGISDQSGKRQLAIVSNDSGSGSLDSSRFKNNHFWHGQRIDPSLIDVVTTTFDSWVEGRFCSQINTANSLLFKIDVEGHELCVLSGMRNSLKSFKGKRLFFIVKAENCNINSVRCFFADMGFIEHRPCWNPLLENFPHHTDLVFKRPS
jgi:FkbM family methyltransferase